MSGSKLDGIHHRLQMTAEEISETALTRPDREQLAAFAGVVQKFAETLRCVAYDFDADAELNDADYEQMARLGEAYMYSKQPNPIHKPELANPAEIAMLDDVFLAEKWPFGSHYREAWFNLRSKLPISAPAAPVLESPAATPGGEQAPRGCQCIISKGYQEETTCRECGLPSHQGIKLNQAQPAPEATRRGDGKGGAELSATQPPSTRASDAPRK
jgi:hypothetical protein